MFEDLFHVPTESVPISDSVTSRLNNPFPHGALYASNEVSYVVSDRIATAILDELKNSFENDNLNPASLTVKSKSLASKTVDRHEMSTGLKLNAPVAGRVSQSNDKEIHTGAVRANKAPGVRGGTLVRKTSAPKGPKRKYEWKNILHKNKRKLYERQGLIGADASTEPNSSSSSADAAAGEQGNVTSPNDIEKIGDGNDSLFDETEGEEFRGDGRQTDDEDDDADKVSDGGLFVKEATGCGARASRVSRGAQAATVRQLAVRASLRIDELYNVAATKGGDGLTSEGSHLKAALDKIKNGEAAELTPLEELYLRDALSEVETE